MIVVGAGRVGTALAALDPERVTLVDRVANWAFVGAEAPGRPGEPIVLAVRNDALPAVLERIPKARHPDLVFVQNGMLRPYLDARGLGEATRGLLFFAVPTRGAALEPGGESPFCGPKAEAVVEDLLAMGVPAAVVDAPKFAAVELEKLIWNSAFGLLCEARACDVGTVVREHGEALRALVAEMLAVGGPELGLVGEAALELEALVERLASYSLSIASYRGAVKEWTWRNGWFVERARARGRACPVHDGLLAEVGRGGAPA
ncbi:hypothetical protein PPSIR1_16645 [Plesiocystis pacifica SIR-1]|uniref:Ketopantoate reductase C-terminal domain-containing protein n=1 Tax=Plesiocystis pacifica SIR-1 TaxID=391625 RepID=A6G384_9BACT|nr:ketopantoate reductase C-terminal domain-containing protein [Plesiocystis pacifica]EDM79709.1 hypothetical protein PPSIR1_16645 [Plesiocystis pacifica SIR-1]